MKWFIPISALVFIFACSSSDRQLVTNDAVVLDLPQGFPKIQFPEDNQLTEARIHLGRRLFYDTRFSKDNTIACASCHLVNQAFTDKNPISIGIEGRTGLRNSMTLANVAYGKRFFMDGGVPSLELQVLAPIHDENEMDHSILEIIKELEQDEEIVKLAAIAYDRPVDPFVITRSIASFMRTMISGNSRYDQYINGDSAVFNQQEVRGLAVFTDQNCTSCHSGFMLSDGDFHNIGLYEEYADKGRERISYTSNDNGKFKTPTLRNIALTGPYMHNGSIETLEEVIDFFISGGNEHINKSALVAPMALSNEEKADLLAFLETLTDEEFVSNVGFTP